jgi:hypothetical protein
MKSRSTTKKLKVKRIQRQTSIRRVAQKISHKPKEPTLLDKIQQVTEELQILRSKLANAGDQLTTVGTHRITALEGDLERLWEMRRLEQAAPLRDTALSEDEERDLAYPSSGRTRS